jgi:hypothetical protein
VETTSRSQGVIDGNGIDGRTFVKDRDSRENN